MSSNINQEQAGQSGTQDDGNTHPPKPILKKQPEIDKNYPDRCVIQPH